jgi:hypothetical protein
MGCFTTRPVRTKALFNQGLFLWGNTFTPLPTVGMKVRRKVFHEIRSSVYQITIKDDKDLRSQNLT